MWPPVDDDHEITSAHLNGVPFIPYGSVVLLLWTPRGCFPEKFSTSP